MKTLIVLFCGICLLSTSVKAQTVEKKQAKIEKKNVTIVKKNPVKLQKIKPIPSNKTSTNKKDEKVVTPKQVTIEPKK